MSSLNLNSKLSDRSVLSPGIAIRGPDDPIPTLTESQQELVKRDGTTVDEILAKFSREATESGPEDSNLRSVQVYGHLDAERASEAYFHPGATLDSQWSIAGALSLKRNQTMRPVYESRLGKLLTDAAEERKKGAEEFGWSAEADDTEALREVSSRLTEEGRLSEKGTYMLSYDCWLESLVDIYRNRRPQYWSVANKMEEVIMTLPEAVQPAARQMAKIYSYANQLSDREYGKERRTSERQECYGTWDEQIADSRRFNTGE